MSKYKLTENEISDGGKSYILIRTGVICDGDEGYKKAIKCVEESEFGIPTLNAVYIDGAPTVAEREREFSVVA